MEVRNSELHGLGVFATQAIKKGTRIIEYLGDKISHAEADRRYETKDDNDNHTFLFSVDRKLVIDAGEKGNDARYFNHSCDPNCESVIEQRRVFIEAIKDISAGDEMTYDYQIGRERTDPPNIDEIYSCRCGAAECRGTMLLPAKRPAPGKARKKAAAKKKAAGRSVAAKKGAAAKKGGPSKKGALSKKSVLSKKDAATSKRAAAGSKASTKTQQRAGSKVAVKGKKKSRGGSRAR